jgi:hypothetical protein
MFSTTLHGFLCTSGFSVELKGFPVELGCFLCVEQGFQRNYSVSSVIAGFQVGIQTFQIWSLVRTTECQVVFMVSGWLKEILVGIQGFQ